MSDPVLVFFDTEFTDFTAQRPALISIGCVTLDGHEFYAELTDTWTKNMCSPFVIDEVLPLLEGGTHRMTELEMTRQLKGWIEGLGDEALFVSDAPVFDWPLVQEVFDKQGEPLNLRRKCASLTFESDEQAEQFNQAVEEYWNKNPEMRHHALYDARSNLSAWLALGNREGRSALIFDGSASEI